MIGAGAAFIYSMGLLIPIVFFIVGGGLLLAKRTRIFGVLFVLFPGIFGFSMMSTRFIDQVQFHARLSKLEPAEVVAIQMPDTVISRREDIDRIVAAIRNSQWFLPNHGGWSTAIPVTVRLKTRGNVDCSVAIYLKQEGAVVFCNQSQAIEFCSDLAKAFRASGIELPIAEEDRRLYVRK